MSNVYQLHIDIDACLCGACENDTFFLARKNGVIIAYCSECHAPVIDPKCECVKGIRDNDL
jgi:NAD-dependent SIR2 family protein deacetylase